MIDADLLAGRSLREVARRYGISKDIAHRHEAHIDPEQRAEIRTAASFDVLDVAGRIRDLANDARATRIALQGAGQHRAALRASEVELRVLGDLSDRLGIDDIAVVDRMREAEAVAYALLTSLRLHPEIAPEIAADLRRRGHGAIAANVEQFAADKTTTATAEGITS